MNRNLPGKWDAYPSLQALKDALQEGVDYEIQVLNRDSVVTIVSPHGGHIEAGTSAIAQAIASEQYNLFDFRGLRSENAHTLHITSTRFRDPQLNALLEKSHFAIAVHAMYRFNRPLPAAATNAESESEIWVGGLNITLRDLIVAKLGNAGFSATSKFPRFRGEHPNNFVNQPTHRGVQLELSVSALQSLFSSNEALFDVNCKASRSERLQAFAAAIRESISQELLRLGS